MNRNAFIHRLLDPGAMGKIDEPWKYDGNGGIEDANGVPVAYVSNYHQAQVPLIMNAPKLLRAAKRIVTSCTDEAINWGLLDSLKAAIEASEEQAK
jgi:hypothetical protein